MSKNSWRNWLWVLGLGLMLASAGCGGGGGGVDCSKCSNDDRRMECENTYSQCHVSGPGSNALNRVCRQAAETVCSVDISIDGGASDGG